MNYEAKKWMTPALMLGGMGALALGVLRNIIGEWSKEEMEMQYWGKIRAIGQALRAAKLSAVGWPFYFAGSLLDDLAALRRHAREISEAQRKADETAKRMFDRLEATIGSFEKGKKGAVQPRQRLTGVNVIVNGLMHYAVHLDHGRVSYHQIVKLAYGERAARRGLHTVTWTATFGRGGTLTKGEWVQAVDGMIFNVADTSRG